MSDLDSSYDEPSGRSSAVAVVLATVFLTLLGAMVGLIIGMTQNNSGANVANQSPEPTGPSPAVTVTETAPSHDNGGGGGTKAPNPGKTYPPVSKDDCPKQTDERAGVELSLQFYVKTAKSEVWICKANGRYIYQGHVLNKPFNNDSTLFLSDPYYEAGVWRADNGENFSYLVSDDGIRHEEKGVEKWHEPAVDTNGDVAPH